MILVTGATGFVGRHLVRGLLDKGYRVRGLVRKASDRLPEGADVAVGNVNAPESLGTAVMGCDAVIHLVGIIQEAKGFSFRSVHVEGTRNILKAAKRAGTVRHFIYQSALGTRKDAPTEYFRTKYEAEELAKASGLDWTITRPSIIYGPGDGFTRTMTGLIRSSLPFVPVIGDGNGLLQPVYIGDLVEVFLRVIYGKEYFGKTLELCGPDMLTFNQVMEDIMDAMGSDKKTIHIPISLMRPVAAVMEKILSNPPVTNDQITMLQEDNTCGKAELEKFCIKPVDFKAGLRRFLS